MSDLLKLAERCEKASGPDRALDCEIAVAIGWFSARKGQKSDPVDYVDIRETGRENWPGYGGDQLVPELTGSIDAALTVTPKGSRVEVEIEGDWACAQVNPDMDRWPYSPSGGSNAPSCDEAKTGALAILAAALRALDALSPVGRTKDSSNG